MKKIKYTLVLLTCLILNVSSQTLENKWNLNIYGGKNDYVGSYSKSIRFFDSYFFISGLQFSKYFNSKFDWAIDFNHGVWSYSPNDNDYFVIRGFQSFSASVRYRPFRLDTKKISPFAAIGFGTRLFTTPTYGVKESNYDIIFPVILGIDFKLGKHTAIRYKTVFGFTNSNLNDGSLGTENNIFANDAFFSNNLGFVFHIGPLPKRVKKPKPIKAVKIEIIDKDKDGVPDDEDECPDVQGIGNYNGCPDNDKDGDGILNELDKCPEIKGDARFSGCLDSDNDGISDFNDKCPNVYGKLTTSGCPDSDEDGVSEDIDKCPTEFGLAINNGCPDSDNDGVIDIIDKCPAVFGVKELNGCPKPITLNNEKLKELGKGIQFETGSSVLKNASYIILNQIAVELRNNLNLNLIIEVHTDNKGNADKNLILSKKRAIVIKDYLISQGISAVRLSSAGFGGTKPIANNNTEEGRTLNRRVDLILK
jgi:outer membrane protein OmpA-like peptidoglycan-associated protein